MTTGSTDPSDYFPWLKLWSPGLVPQLLAQSILQGWSLVSITTNNSSAPDTERRILEQDSYGRQIGKLLDAVDQLIAERPAGAAARPAYEELRKLRGRVEQAKTQAAADRLDRITDDLARLKAEDPAAYAARMKALLALLREQVERP